MDFANLHLVQLIREAEALPSDWRWLVRACAEYEDKPGPYLANVSNGLIPAFFPVFAASPEAALAESLRRATLFIAEGVK